MRCLACDEMMESNPTPGMACYCPRCECANVRSHTGEQFISTVPARVREAIRNGVTNAGLAAKIAVLKRQATELLETLKEMR